MRHASILLLAGLAVLLSAAAPASAASVDDVRLTADLPTRGDGQQVLRITDEPVDVVLHLHNLGDAPRKVQVYAVAALQRDEGRGPQLAPRGSADWLGLSPATARLDAGEEHDLTFTVRPHRLPEEPPGQIAFVVETGSDSTLVTRAATLAQLDTSGVLGAPAAPFLLAALLLLLMLAAHVGRKLLDRRAQGLPPAPATRIP